MKKPVILLFLCLLYCITVTAQSKPKFRVIAFYTGKNDQAHISFVHEANKWFPEMAEEISFRL